MRPVPRQAGSVLETPSTGITLWVLASQASTTWLGVTPSRAAVSRTASSWLWVPGVLILLWHWWIGAAVGAAEQTGIAENRHVQLRRVAGELVVQLHLRREVGVLARGLVGSP
jgi:hypothetical protein